MILLLTWTENHNEIQSGHWKVFNITQVICTKTRTEYLYENNVYFLITQKYTPSIVYPTLRMDMTS